jgi:DNA (cytosine-5)-methyltransferase 1
MTKYICETCQKVFSQKGHFEDHNNRKRPCKKNNIIETLVEKKIQEALSMENKIEDKNDTVEIQTIQIDYSKKTREELISICKEKKIKGYSGKKKEDIISLLNNEVINYVTPPLMTNIVTSSFNSETSKNMTYIDLFAGIGGFRYGINYFAEKYPEYSFKCVKTADIKKDAIQTYNLNFNETNQSCDVRSLKNIPYFDILCAGFPCQPFSSAGKRKGLSDEGRGDLIYEVARICKESKPNYIILENVSNIENIEKGEVLKSIVSEFEKIGYKITCSLINSSQVGLAQCRSRLFIVGCLSKEPNIIIKPAPVITVKNIIDENDTNTNLPEEFLNKLLSIPKEKLVGKSIKDKRGGDSNIHSWDIDYHGKISQRKKNLLNTLLLERRKKKWATEKNIKWMDGIPLSYDDIKTFLNYDGLQEDLDDLVEKKYLVMEYPKELVDGKRVPSLSLPIGYNIAKGKLSFPISKILNPDELSPTLTATDSSKLAVYVGNTIRQLNEKELKLLCGFPESMQLPKNVNKYDLFGNMVCPPVITTILESLLLPSD